MDLYPSAKPKILLVDDTPANLALISSLLHPFFTVNAVNRGAKVLNICINQQPDLILLDNTMPDLDSHEVCGQLKTHILTHPIPVIFLTSKNEMEDEQWVWTLVQWTTSCARSIRRTCCPA